ncbi:MAG: glutathione S-transferase [Halioglobus sp.]|jgi:glutathione S-transferase
MYQGIYGLYGMELSMFSRKLEAQLRFQNIPHEWRFKTDARSKEIEARCGTHFIPALVTPDNWVIHDTIALGPFLNSRFDEAAVIPSGPIQRACCFVLEDIFNHWLGRVAVHTRWCYPENVAWVGPRFGANGTLDRSIDVPFSDEELLQLAPIGEAMRDGFGLPVCNNTGVGPEQSESVKADFTDMLSVLSQHFATNNFLLGPRPCLADFALAGACKAHFVTDPTPVSWLGDHKDMLFAYTDRVFNADAEDAQWMGNDALPESLRSIFDYAQKTYFVFAPASISAGLRGEKYYEYDYGYGPTRARSQKRLEKARLHVGNEISRLGEPAVDSFKSAFAQYSFPHFYLAESLV